ncbi:MAG: hypothetical protein K0R46_1795 [Herbinix sp.]|nr:hypothetical protein [Herbinix sp.]
MIVSDWVLDNIIIHMIKAINNCSKINEILSRNIYILRSKGGVETNWFIQSTIFYIVIFPV